MAIIKFTNSKSTLKNIIKYVTQEVKTTPDLITGKDCSSENCLDEMNTVKNLYNKTDGRQYIHLIQSFSPTDNLTSTKAHEIGLELAKQYTGFQVLVATHIDREHLHNHLIINSVSFENRKKFQQSAKDLERIKEYSNKLCAENGLATIPLKSNLQVSSSLTLKEYQLAMKGQSWKMQLINAIDYSMANSINKSEFISNMNNLGYQVNWTDTRKNITYTTPNGMKCRDNKLYDEKYLKENMQNEFNRRIKGEKSDVWADTKYTRVIHNSTGKVDNFVQMDGRYSKENSKNRLQSERTNFKGRYSEYFERRDFRDKNKIGNTDDEISRGIEKTTKSKSETYIQRNTNWNSNRYVSNTTLDTLVTLAYLLNTNRQNRPHRHKRKIRSFRNLSKRAQKEWIKLHKNSSSIDWYEEDEYEM